MGTSDSPSTVTRSQDAAPRALLAVDLGLRSGMALYDGSGTLRWCRSTHFANKSMLRQAVPSILRKNPEISHLVMEGDRMLDTFIWTVNGSRAVQLSVFASPAHSAPCGSVQWDRGCINSF